MKQKEQKTIGFTKSQMQKIESEANDFRTKYPEIAKMTVQEVVETELFAANLPKAVNANKVGNYYAFLSLKNSNAFDIDTFRNEYIACMTQQSKMPAAKRIIIVAIGNDAYKRTVNQMIKDYEESKGGPNL